MIETIYIENGADTFPLSQSIRQRFHNARFIECEQYGEVFNRKAQNFRLQKRSPALILAVKQGAMLLPAPDNYGIGSDRNFYFSHMLNCIYDCRYCFLQGMYRSANYVLFVNFNDFITAIRRTIDNENGNEVHFFSGYDCDSLALEPVTDFTRHFLPVFVDYPNALIELRTKSTQIRSLLQMPVVPNAVIAFSFSPQEIAEALEHRTPAVEKRIQALLALQERGWQVGLRYDPLIYTDSYQDHYGDLFRNIHSRVDNASLHSVSLGSFRLPTAFFRRIHDLYPEEPLFAAGMMEHQGMVGYRDELREELLHYCIHELKKYVTAGKIFPCHT